MKIKIKNIYGLEIKYDTNRQHRTNQIARVDGNVAHVIKQVLSAGGIMWLSKYNLSERTRITNEVIILQFIATFNSGIYRLDYVKLQTGSLH